ncbi:hypothetical protein MSAR_01540 [Mycolicibacterium sarraceniae]|uniref:Transposase DDE domain-containing protein n=1 Tax=Mycolicibacterium sarraceniae TaxID=1534348 RepID=A0A7I7SJS4_9MYCO|nr:hypothetical protein MSAR_01540 [Mycolicibacterium sarraceniae]
MKSIAVASRVKVSADGQGVVSHAGMGLLRELADLTGLSLQVTAVLADTYRGRWVYAPGEVFADLAAAVADCADCIDGVGQLCGHPEISARKFSAGAVHPSVPRHTDGADHQPQPRSHLGHHIGTLTDGTTPHGRHPERRSTGPRNHPRGGPPQSSFPAQA